MACSNWHWQRAAPHIPTAVDAKPDPNQQQMLCGRHYDNPTWAEFLESCGFPHVTLRIHHDRVRVHEHVLNSHSQFFLHQLSLNKNGELDLNALPLTPEGVRMVVEFMYDGKVAVAADCFYHVLLAATTLDVPELRRLLGAYLLAVVQNVDHALWCLELVYAMPIEPIVQLQVTEQCAKSLCRLLNQQTFVHLHWPPLCALLHCAKNTLQPDDVMQLVSALCRWMVGKPDRLEASDELLSMVPFELLTNQQRAKCVREGEVYGLVLDLGLGASDDKHPVCAPTARRATAGTSSLSCEIDTQQKPLSGLQLMVSEDARIKLVVRQKRTIHNWRMM